MGTSHSMAEVAAKLDKAGRNLMDARRDAVKAGALVMKAGLLKGAAAAAGSDRRMSNVGRRGALLGVGFEIKGSDPVATMKPRGPWALSEYGSKPHEIGGRRRRGAPAKVLRFGDGSFRRVVHHRGAAGKHRWSQAKGATTPETMRAVGGPMVKAVAKAF